MFEEFGNGLIFQGRETQQHRVVSQLASQLRLRYGLAALSANAGDLDDVMAAAGFQGEAQDRFEQSEFRIANFELGGVHTHGNASRTSGQIISGQSTLPALVQLAIAVEGEWMGGNHKAGAEFFAQRHQQPHQNFPSRVWKCVGLLSITPP